MKITSLGSLLLVSILIPTLVQAFGNNKTWVRGWGQGHSEFIILGKGQSQLYLACEDTGSEPVTLIFTDVNGHEVSMDSGKQLLIKIDDEEPADISGTNSRFGANNILWAWEHLRTGKQVVVSGEGVRPATFTLNEAGKVLPKFGTHGCVPKFDL
ncbi:hypothetical protein [Serratia sp. D1N4]